jgi:hypothetical protein
MVDSLGTRRKKIMQKDFGRKKMRANKKKAKKAKEKRKRKRWYL